ncbi:MAG TPA: glycoside hydrolase family 2 TIM barrel-domain containing protein [Armatimonadota bacterium]
MFTTRESSLDLNGTWKFIPDPMLRSQRQQWWKKERDPHAIFPCWDMDGLWDIQVPGAWNCLISELTWYEGYGLYVKEFTLPEIPVGYEAYLCFDGAVYSTEVWLNGAWVGLHPCGYSPFHFRVTPFLQTQNRLMVLAENVRKDERVPGSIFDWANDGGLIRPVKLILVPERHVEDFTVATRLEGDTVAITVDACFTSRDQSTPAALRVNFPELGLAATQTVCAGEHAVFTFYLPRTAVTLWAPGQPQLYTIAVSCDDEVVRDEVGLREIRAEGRDILLNGERIQLWGVCVHSEFKAMGRTDTPELLDEFFALVHDLGVNYLRCAHYPYSEAFVRRADREGLLLWEEVPAYWQVRINEPDTKALALQMMREMIERDHNRASVIIWSVSNECEWQNPEGPDGNYQYGIECAQMIRQLDPTRLISAAEGNVVMSKTPWTPASSDQFGYEGEARRAWRPSLPDEFFAAMDIIAMNCYVGSYGEQAVEDLADALAVWYPFNKPVLLSEFGCVSRRGDERNDLTVGGERRHVDIIRRAYAVMADTPWLAGASIWSLMDYRTPLHWEGFLEDGGAVGPFGLCDRQFQPKQAYFAVKEALAQLTCSEITLPVY